MASVDTPLRAASLEGELLCGQYQVEALIGEGGMAWVYKATDAETGDVVAVKVLREHRQRSASGEARFLREAEIQAQLQHPHIVQVHRVFEERGVVGFVQEWCAGGDLHKLLLEHQGPLPRQRLEQLFLPLLDAVAYAHDEGLIHRDIKPANILLHGDDSTDEELVKLNDFGLVKVLALDSLTSTGTVMGTVHYMAPEQFEETKDVDHRADIYSLGVLLYEMSTGRLPFTGRMPALGMKIIKSEPPPPREAPYALHPVLARCLAKRPHARYQSCRAMQRALLDALQQPEEAEVAAVSSFDGLSPVRLARATPIQAHVHTSAKIHQKTPFGGHLQHTMGAPAPTSQGDEVPLGPMSTTDAMAQAWPHDHSPETAPTYPLEALREEDLAAAPPAKSSLKGLFVLLLLGFGIGIGGALYIQHQRQPSGLIHRAKARSDRPTTPRSRDRAGHSRQAVVAKERRMAPGPDASRRARVAVGRRVALRSHGAARMQPSRAVAAASARPPAARVLGPSGQLPPVSRRAASKPPAAPRPPAARGVVKRAVPALRRPVAPRPRALPPGARSWDRRTPPLPAGVTAFRLAPKNRPRTIDPNATLFRSALAHEARKDFPKARQLLQQGCDRKIPAACARLAWFFVKGLGGAKAPKQGIAMFEKACGLDHTLSCKQLGMIYQQGHLQLPIQPKKARRWYGIACQKGQQESCVRLGMMWWRGDGGPRQRKKAMALFKSSCEKRSGLGCRAVSYVYFQKLKDVPNRLQLGREYARKGCALGEPTSCVKVGEAYYLGRGGPKDYRKSFLFFSKACKLKQGAGCFYLAGALSHGIGVKRQPKKALRYAKLSCQLKDKDGCHVLGRLYSQGVGTARDCKKANASYQQACQLGEKTACREFCVEQKSSPLDLE